MSSLDRFKKDLKRLIEVGIRLQLGMIQDLGELTDEVKKQTDKKPLNFRQNYEQWYSEAKEVIIQVLPGRSGDFSALYEKPKGRKALEYGNYTIADYMINIKRTYAGEVVVDSSAALPKFQQQLTILMAANDRFESSLFDIKQVLQADLFDSELDAAKHLNKNGFVRAAGALAGVVIESHLQQVCESHNIKITKNNPTINDLNQSLKDNDVIDTPQWRKIQHLADLRNLCDHKKSKDPTKDQIDELIESTDKLIKTVF